jgi:phytoene dehydrogenase-like protein
VVGVVLKDGTDVNARSVISNADYKHTFLKLIDPEVLPPDWHKAVSEAHQTGSILQVCLGVDAEKVDLSALEEASRLVYRRARNDFNDQNPDWNAFEIDPEVLTAQELEISLWGEKRLPTGKKGSVIVIRTDAEYRHFERYRSPSQRRLPGYQEYKTRLGLALIREIERLLPGIQDSILVTDVATPLTFEDQGGRSQGAVAGWSWDYEDFKDNQPKELIRTPIRGLYMAGYQAFSALFMGGVPTAMESGKRAARAVLEEEEPTDEILIPLPHSPSK